MIKYPLEEITWKRVELPFSGDVKKIDNINNNTLIAHGTHNKAAITTDFGLTWHPYQPRERRKYRKYK